MLSELISAIDRVINLLDRQLREKRYIFEEHLDPLFADLSLIHNDYRGAFAEIYAQLSKGVDLEQSVQCDSGDKTDTSVVIPDPVLRDDIKQLLLDKKHSLQPLRDKVDALLDVLLKSERCAKSEDFGIFLLSCQHYICSGGTSRYTSAIHFICDGKRFLDPDFAKKHIRYVIQRLELSWKWVVTCYARLKASTFK